MFRATRNQREMKVAPRAAIAELAREQVRKKIAVSLWRIGASFGVDYSSRLL